MPARTVPQVLALLHPDAQDPPGEWPQFSDEAHGCSGEIIVHRGRDGDTQWIECFGSCDLSNETLQALHSSKVAHGCAQGLADTLAVTFQKPCVYCRVSSSASI